MTPATFTAHIKAFDTALILSTFSTDKATDISMTPSSGALFIEVKGFLYVNTPGTFIPRFSKILTVGSTLAILEGSTLEIFDYQPTLIGAQPVKGFYTGFDGPDMKWNSIGYRDVGLGALAALDDPANAQFTLQLVTSPLPVVFFELESESLVTGESVDMP